MDFTSEGQFCSDVVTFNWILDHIRYLFVCVCIFSIVLNVSKPFPLKVFFKEHIKKYTCQRNFKLFYHFFLFSHRIEDSVDTDIMYKIQNSCGILIAHRAL